MTFPNTNQPQTQPNPDPSAQGNNSPSSAGNGTVQPPTGNAPAAELTPEQLLSLVSQAQGATGIRFQDLPDEARRLLNSVAAAARRDGEAAGRTAADTAARQAQEDEERRRRETDGAADQRAAAATERANTAERERDEARRELLQLRVAMRVGSELGIQNPERYADRLRGTTEQEIEADARGFFPSVAGVVPRPEIPPATPQGGNEPPSSPNPPNPNPNPQPPRDRAQATEAQRSSGAYDLV